MRARARRPGRPTRVDLTPLLDTVFLLIVMLMCSIIHMRVVNVVSVRRPVVRTGSSPLGEGKVLEVAVRRDGQILFGGANVSLDDLPRLLTRRARDAEACLLCADRDARHGRVAQVLVAAKRALPDRPIYFEVEQTREGTTARGTVP